MTGYYLDALNRVPAPSEVSSWETAIAADGVAAAMNAFMASPEFQANRAALYYEQYLKRTPSAAEMQYLINLFTAGTTLDAEFYSVISSPEFANDFGGSTPAGLAQAIYQEVLGRTGSSAEIGYWANYAASSGLPAMIQGIIFSSEANGDRVSTDYETYLGRAVDSGGYTGFTNYMNSGGTENGVVSLLLSSAEGQAHVSAVAQPGFNTACP